MKPPTAEAYPNGRGCEACMHGSASEYSVSIALARITTRLDSARSPDAGAGPHARGRTMELLRTGSLADNASQPVKSVAKDGSRGTISARLPAGQGQPRCRSSREERCARAGEQRSESGRGAPRSQLPPPPLKVYALDIREGCYRPARVATNPTIHEFPAVGRPRLRLRPLRGPS
eukprot:4317811-Prymnesium_polylepis.2